MSAAADRGWSTATKANPCPACGNLDWCMHGVAGGLCNRGMTPDGCHAGDERDGGARIWWTDAPAAPGDRPAPVPRPSKPIAPRRGTSGEIDRVNSRLLALCPLTSEHRDHLSKVRRLSPEEIAAARFGSLPSGPALRKVTDILTREFGDMLQRVPGFRIGKGGAVEIVAAGAGILIPYIDGDTVTALRLRLDGPADGGRYRWLSGGGSPSVEQSAYVVTPATRKPGLAILTEGEFKDHAAAKHWDALAVGVPGVDSYRLALPALKEHGIKDVIVAMDADHRAKPGVYRATRAAVELLGEEGYTVRLLLWDGDAKGVDDAIHAGAAFNELTGEDIDEHLRTVAEGLGLAAPVVEEAKLADEVWPSPEPPREDALPEFPLEIFPPWCRDYLVDLSRVLQTPPDFVGMLTLGFLAITYQKRFRVAIHSAWTEPLILWILMIAPSGGRKSPAFSKVFKPAESWEQYMREQFGDVRRRAKRQIRTLETEIETAKKAKVKNLTFIAEQEERLDSLSVPAVPRLFTGTATPEAIEERLGQHHGRYGFASAESDILAVLMGKYRQGAPPIEGLLSGWTGEAIKADYRSRDDVDVAEAHFSQVLCTQPDNAREMYDNQKLSGRGALGRYLPCRPVCPISDDWIEGDADPRLGQVFQEGFMRMLPDLGEALRVYVGDSGDGNEDPSPLGWVTRDLVLSGDAKALLKAFYKRTQRRRQVGGDLQFLEEWSAKFAGQVVRIAGLLHLCDHAFGKAPRDVSPSAMERAIFLGEEYLVPHAQAAFGSVVSGFVEKVWGVIRKIGSREIPRTELFRAVKPMSAGALTASLQELEDRNFLRVESRPSTGGKPPSFIMVNPNANSDFQGTKGTKGTKSRKLHFTGFESDSKKGTKSAQSRVLSPPDTLCPTLYPLCTHEPKSSKPHNQAENGTLYLSTLCAQTLRHKDPTGQAPEVQRKSEISPTVENEVSLADLLDGLL